MYDFAIIGSGVSGGRLAYELTVGGAKCLLIEAGKAFDRHSFPPDELGYSTQMFWGGGMEVSSDGRFGFLRGKCLGGTSVVNQADLNRFDDLALDDWRDRTGVDFFNSAVLNGLYDELDRTVTSGEIPDAHYNRNARLFIEAFGKRGLGWAPIQRAQSDCKFGEGSDCIVCLGGCPRDAKQSTLVTTIPAASNLGLKVETEFEVNSIDDEGGQVRIFGVQRRTARELVARRVVLAGGVMGNVAILARSERLARRLPALGAGFACHPQFMTFGLYAEPVDAHKGPLQAVEAHDASIRAAGLKFENVFAPPIATALLLPGIAGEHLAVMKRYRHFACIEVAVRDEPAGRVRLDRKGKLVIQKPITDADRSKIDGGLEMAIGLHHAAGAERVICCDQGFGLHLMGGCAIGTDPARSVVGPDFRVHGHKNVYAADSSIFPAAPGINPSFTIMALTLKASRSMLEQEQS